MTTPPVNKVLDRILKLFRLAAESANTTEAEMNAAMTKAKSLMAQHDITMADVEHAVGQGTAARYTVIIEQHTAYTRKLRNFAPYDHCVALAIGHLTETKALLTSRSVGGAHYISMTFVGHEADARLAADLYLVILEGVRRAARVAYGPGWSNAHTSYAVGFGTRLIDRARLAATDLTPDQTSTVALVVASKTDAIDRWMEERNIGTSRRKTTKLQAGAYEHGYADGATMNLAARRTIRGRSA